MDKEGSDMTRRLTIVIGTCWALLDVAWTAITGREVNDDDED